MQVSFAVILVFSCLIANITAPRGDRNGGSTPVKGSRFSQWRKKIPGWSPGDVKAQLAQKVPFSAGDVKSQIARAKANLMDPNARAKMVSKMTNGVKANVMDSKGRARMVSMVTNGVKDKISGSAPIDETVLRLSDACEWLNVYINENNINSKSYQRLEYKLVDYYAHDSAYPHRFQVKLHHVHSAKRAFDPITKKQSKPDIRDRGNLKLDENGPTDPTDDPKCNLDCNKRCITNYGYVIKPLEPRGYMKGAARRARVPWGLKPSDGVIIPITKAFVTYDRWSGLKNDAYKQGYSPYVCYCETRTDFEDLLIAYNIDTGRFKELKKMSSTRALGYLEKEFANTELELLDHDAFLLATIEAVLKSGKAAKGIEMESMEPQTETLHTGEDALNWEQSRFHRTPTMQLQRQQTIASD